MKNQTECEAIVTVDSRFHGPADSGNGGYVSGLLAAHIKGPAEITLRQPPPLGTELCVKQMGEGQFHLLADEVLIAEGRPSQIEIEVPRCPSFEAAQLASQNYVGFKEHWFPTCFVCGPDRSDGLGIFAGPVPGEELVAAPWIPAEWLADERGYVEQKFLWASLDCPGAYIIPRNDNTAKVLGRITVELIAKVRPGMKLVAMGWYRGSEGRKHYVGTALCNEDGTVLAQADAVWISLKE